MKPFWFWFCEVAVYSLDRVPGFCRYYTVPNLMLSAKRPPHRAEMEVHWEWRWHAYWGVRLLSRLGMLDHWADELEHRRRDKSQNPSSAS